MDHRYQAAFKVLQAQGLILEKHMGIMSLEGLKVFLKEKEISPDFSDSHSYLLDVTKTKYSRNVDNVKAFVQYLQQKHANIKNCRVAVLFNEIEQRAMVSTFKLLFGATSRQFHAFSCLEEALIWLHIDVSADCIQKELDGMKTEFKDHLIY